VRLRQSRRVGRGLRRQHAGNLTPLVRCRSRARLMATSMPHLSHGTKRPSSLASTRTRWEEDAPRNRGASISRLSSVGVRRSRPLPDTPALTEGPASVARTSSRVNHPPPRQRSHASPRYASEPGACSRTADCERREERQSVNRGRGFAGPDRRASKAASSLTTLQHLEPTPTVFHGVEPEAGSEYAPGRGRHAVVNAVSQTR
jgi:hypothetical protein